MFYTYESVSVRRAHLPAAFTLLEIMVTMAIVAALGAIALHGAHRASQASRVARAKAELAVLATALEDYRRMCGDYPRTNDASRLLQALIGQRGPRDEAVRLHSFVELARFSVSGVSDPFSDATAVIVDPWGRSYRYAYRTQSPWDNPGYVLYSVGSDGLDSAGLLPGGFADSAPLENTDNLYANSAP